MNNTFHQLLIASVCILLVGSCKKQETHDDHDHENEVITSIGIMLRDTVNSDSTHGAWRQPAGPGTTIYTDTLRLKGGVGYVGSLAVLDESKTPVADLTESIRSLANEHRFFFESGNASVKVKVTDKDSQVPSMELGLQVSVQADSSFTGSGLLKITLRHYTTTSPKSGGISAGSTDAEVEIPYVVK